MWKSHQNCLTQVTKTWLKVWTSFPLTGQKWGKKPRKEKIWMNVWSAQRSFLWSHFYPVVTKLSAQIAGNISILLKLMPALWVPSLKVKKCLKCKEHVVSKKIQVIRKAK